MKDYSIGVDVGATNIKMGLIHRSGKILKREHLVTKDYFQSPKSLTQAMIKAIEDLIVSRNINPKSISGIGVGLPGLVDSQKGIVRVLTNIPGWRDVPLKNIIQNEFKIPAFLDNDVNLITLGEWRYGAGRGVANLVCITLGTGVGGGLILNNEIYRGEGFVAGEIGHIPINEKGPSCPCGGMACFERYVGNKHLLSDAKKIFKKKDLRLEDVYNMANEGQPRAIRFWNDVGVQIGHSLIGVVNLLNPRRIIIGGGISNSYKFMHKMIKQEIKQRAMSIPSRMVHVKRAQLGVDAVLFGTLVLIEEKIIGRK